MPTVRKMKGGDVYRSVNTKFWTDPVTKILSSTERFVFIYLMTSPRSHLSGVYSIPVDAIAKDTRVTRPRVVDGLRALERHGKIVYDHDTEEVWVVNMLKHQGRGQKIDRAVQKSLDEIHSKDVVKRMVNHYKKLGYGIGYPTRWGIGYPSVKDQYQDQDQDQKEGEGKTADGASAAPSRARPAKKAKEPDDEPIRFWKDALEHPDAKVSEDRLGKVRARRRERFTNFDMMWAIVGCACSDWHMRRGKHSGGKRRDQFVLILQDATHVERFHAEVDREEAKRVIDRWRKTGVTSFGDAVEEGGDAGGGGAAAGRDPVPPGVGDS